MARKLALGIVAAIGCIALAFTWPNQTGTVSMFIADDKALVASDPGSSQIIPITVVNETATRARIVGTNAC